jgi:flavorubredoxin
MATHREFSPGIHWIQECGPDRKGIADSVRASGGTWCTPGLELHVPQNAYLLAGDRTLLFDTLSPASGDLILAALEEILGERGLDFLAISHPDVPHAANTGRILRRWPGARLVAPRVGETHALYHLDDALHVGPEDEIDLGGLVARFPEATFLDAALHTWMSEETTRTLFTVDWLGFPHMEGECLKCVDELPTDIEASRLEAFHSRVMFWFQYVDVQKVVATTNRLARSFEGYALAPAHGLPIREAPERFFEMMNEVVDSVSASGRTGVL